MVFGVGSKDEAASVEALINGTSHRTLIIDAGHGGLDNGASSADGMLEADINLDIALKMNALAQIFGIEAVMTRDSADLPYPEQADTIARKKVWDQKRRVSLVEGTKSGILISIHQNTYPDPRPSGAQVLYAATDGSCELGELVHENLVSSLNPENRRVAAPISKTIYLMNSVSCPAILVECGFLTNAEEAGKLATDEYKTKLAVILLASYMQYVS